MQILRYNHPTQNLLTAILALRAEFGDNDSPEPFTNFISKRLEDASMLLVLAMDGETALGYGLAFDVHEHPYMPEWTRAGYIAQFLISQKYRKHGAGTALMNHINDWFDACGIKKVLLNVDMENEAGNRFWKAQDFTPYAYRMKRIK